VADVQVSVGLRRKAGDHGLILSRAQVFRHDGTDKVQPLALGESRGVGPQVAPALGIDIGHGRSDSFSVDDGRRTPEIRRENPEE
jgi:hypothetical protein